LHDKPSGRGASVASAAGPFTTERARSVNFASCISLHFLLSVISSSLFVYANFLPSLLPSIIVIFLIILFSVSFLTNYHYVRFQVPTW
jgi:CHASE2 domain-containing sensor protein